MSSQGQKLELYQEYPPLGEAAAIEAIEQITRAMLTQTYPEGNRPAKRDQHTKDHGCVRGEFTVEPNLPEEARFGVFKEPRTYPVWIRFSNGFQSSKRDRFKDVRGIAIKLMGVEGEKVLPEEKFEKTQDFLLINYPVFFIRNAIDYLDFFQKRAAKKTMQFFFTGLNPFQWRLHEFIVAKRSVKERVNNLLSIRYWSNLPYKLGPKAVRYSLIPTSPPWDKQPDFNSENYLREGLIEYLQETEARFDFLIQFQTDPYKMPIEDGTIDWDERRSPFQKVATLTIPRQTFNSPAQQKFCENLSFSPWHCLPEHQPLGGINRVRRQVYQAISKLRHEMNQAPRREPTEDEVF
ncbi:MAG: catalase family protein [Chroococcales cyanobacterium]